jgi:hypothetical protein
MGIETVGSLITRGVLIDVAALKGVDMLPDNYEITVRDLEQALQRQMLTLQPGDAVLIHPGWSRLWAKDNARYVKSCPGIGIAAATWLAKQDPMLVGSDNWPVEVAPNPDAQLSLPVHQFMLVVRGIHLLRTRPAYSRRSPGSVREDRCFAWVGERIGGNTRTREPSIRTWIYRLPRSGLVQCVLSSPC